jgi:preflagellin peptidase FlaK
MFLTYESTPTALLTTHGKLVTADDGQSRHGLDLDALRMYLNWRGITFETLCANPAQFKTTAPTRPGPVGDGSELIGEEYTNDTDDEPVPDDAWGAAAFVEAYDAYGTSTVELRDGLERATRDETVYVTPGLPLITSFFAGIVATAFAGPFTTVALRTVVEFVATV